MTKTATTKTFAGRRVAMTNMALLGIGHSPRGYVGSFRIETAVCVGVDNHDDPIWQSLSDPQTTPYEGFQFVEREADLTHATWTFKERV
jgi:hypothetical protein